MEGGGVDGTGLLDSQDAALGLGGGDHGAASGGNSRPEEAAGGSGADVAGAGARRRRGRPRKYGAHGGASRSASSSGGAAVRGSARRGRGRAQGASRAIACVPPVAVGGGPMLEFAGIFDPEIVTIHRGEDVLAKLSGFVEPGTHSLSVLSATGSVSSAILRQSGPLAGVLTFEGCFEILNLNGSFTIGEGRICTGPEVSLVNIMLARPDGQIFGGGVAGPLIAAGPTQIVVAILKDDKDQPEQIAGIAEVDDHSGTPTSVLLEPIDKEANTPIPSGNNDVIPASLRSDEHNPLGPVEPMLDQNMSADTNANVPGL
ncbi:hypothetical protein BT93_J0499 [Corymbia citriodora subsp. variegata]|nr:hypothetical protein BT93_J0499 [Corymbia citriodora subsp. variegata]